LSAPKKYKSNSYSWLCIVYEAQTTLGPGMSRCPTCVGVRHSYDTRTTRVGQLRQVS